MRVEALAALEVRRTRGLRYAAGAFYIEVDTATECQLAYLCALLCVPEAFEDDADVLRARLYACNRTYWLGMLESAARNRHQMRIAQAAAGMPSVYD